MHERHRLTLCRSWQARGIGPTMISGFMRGGSLGIASLSRPAFQAVLPLPSCRERQHAAVFRPADGLVPAALSRGLRLLEAPGWHRIQSEDLPTSSGVRMPCHEATPWPFWKSTAMLCRWFHSSSTVCHFERKSLARQQIVAGTSRLTRRKSHAGGRITQPAAHEANRAVATDNGQAAARSTRCLASLVNYRRRRRGRCPTWGRGRSCAATNRPGEPE